MTIKRTHTEKTAVTPVVSSRDDTVIDRALRPGSLSEYVGQPQIKKNLAIIITAAKQRRENVDHILLHGSAGLGKTTLAHIIATEMGASITVTSGPAIERIGDLGTILTNLSDGDVLFIDEIHRLRRSIEEVLYPAMEDGVMDIVVGKGPSARTLQLDLPRFTLIGATTQIGMLSNPLRNRFGAAYRLAFYDDDEMTAIVTRAAALLEIPIVPTAAREIARRARRTPRVANHLVRRVRDYAQAHGHVTVTDAVVAETLALLEIDDKGLDLADRQLLEKIITAFHGGPVGAKTLAAALAEDIYTIEEVYEPYLVQSGLLIRSPRGRVVTESAYAHLGHPVSQRYRTMRERIGF